MVFEHIAVMPSEVLDSLGLTLFPHKTAASGLDQGIYKRDTTVINEDLSGERNAVMGAFETSLIYVDCTLGGAGHSKLILSKLSTRGHLYSFDQDINVIERHSELAKTYPNWTLVHRNFSELWDYCDEQNIKITGGILMDLGLSSIQLDDPERGFSFQHESALDMRLDPSAELSANDLVNGFKESELADIIYRYGEERLSRQIAKAIVMRRPIQNSKQLADLILGVYHRRGFKDRHRVHPATKTFQALRIYVNRELEVLEEVLNPSALNKYLAKSARVVAISFHSLEDRIVKNAFRALSAKDSGYGFSLLNKKPLQASSEEIRNNPRSRSAKLRALVKSQELL